MEKILSISTDRLERSETYIDHHNVVFRSWPAAETERYGSVLMMMIDTQTSDLIIFLSQDEENLEKKAMPLSVD
jgi:uncharacterized protein YfbU (UPF0304 family)